MTTPRTQRPPQRRVRHDVADGAAVMVFSLTVSVVFAMGVALALTLIGGIG